VHPPIFYQKFTLSRAWQGIIFVIKALSKFARFETGIDEGLTSKQKLWEMRDLWGVVGVALTFFLIQRSVFP